MQNSLDQRHQESLVLTRGVENLCRKLVKILIGRMSLVKLQEIIKFTYIEEIENKLRKENPSKNIPLSQFALLSGLDTRTLTKIRNDDKYKHPLYQESNFLEEITPGASILDSWCNKPPYVDTTTGNPKSLSISGKNDSFEALFKENTKSRGVTYKSLLNRLSESGSVSLDREKQQVTLVSNSYLPSVSNDILGAIEMGFSAIGNLIDTVSHNITSLEHGEDRLYQRGSWAFRLNPDNKTELREKLNHLLDETDSTAREIFSRYECEYSNPDQYTAGISLFYFEE